MHSRFFRLVVVCAAVAALGSFAVLQAAISLSTSSPSTQSFDGMGIPATATTPSTLPGDFRADNPATVRTVGSFSSAGTTTTRAGGANLSSSAGNGIYSFGAGTTTLGSSDRAVGFLSSGTATASGNLYAQYTNNSGDDLTGLKISYDVEKYRMGINTAGFCVQLYYSTTGTAGSWTAAASFLTTFPRDPGTTNSGYATAPGDVKSVSNKALAVPVPNGSSIFLVWNYSVCSGSTTTNGQALAIDNISVLGTSSTAATPPAAAMSVSPSSLNVNDPFTATVAVTPGTNAIASVTGDLSSIGLGTQTFTNAGGNTYTYSGVVPSGVTGGTKQLTATVTDTGSPALTAQASTNLTILTHTAPTGTGSANPPTVAPGAQTTLTVNVTPGANPASTGLAVVGDLSAIGVTGPQAFSPAGGTTFTYSATIGAAISDGGKTLPITISDAQGASSVLNLALNVATPFVAPSLKISQVYGGGGNSGATYRSDFVELFNAGTTPVDLTNYSVQVASASASTWNVTAICQTTPCVIQPGRYFLVVEAPGTSESKLQIPPPAPDASGSILMGATGTKVALVADTGALAGSCPVGGKIVDFVGSGSSANCAETQPALAPSNTTAVVRAGGGCTDTDNNRSDFAAISPIPRNSGSPAHVCGDGVHLSAVGTAVPDGPMRRDSTLLTVKVTPAAGSTLSGTSVVVDLSSIGGSPAQTFFDDGTNGDLSAGDGTFSFGTTVSPLAAFGMHNLPITITDGISQTLAEPIPLSVTLPSCGSERWFVKVGDDDFAQNVDLLNVQPTTIQALRAFTAPGLDTTQPDEFRVGPVELTTWRVNATMTLFKLETDVDYHIVLSDTSDTIISEIPLPDCATEASPFKPAIAAARATFDAHLSATPQFQSVTLPVVVTGVGFFDFIHGQTGVAPNGIELHPVVDIKFLGITTTTVASSTNPSRYQDAVTFSAAVTTNGEAPTGQVTFFDGGAPIGAGTLDANGQTAFATNALSVGQHSITAAYAGDANSIASRSTALVQTVGQADQTIAFDPIAGRSFGDPDFAINASSTSGLGVTLAVVGGPATLAGNTVHITGAGSVTIRATQTGDGNFTAAAPVEQTFTIAKASQTIVFNGPAPAPRYGALPFDVTATGGASGNSVTFTGNGACTVAGQNGIATVTIVSGGDCRVVASQAGNSNYLAAPDATEVITVGRATAEIDVSPVSVVYDGQAHGLKGSAVGVHAEDLSALLVLGATFTSVPGGTANWSFAGNADYLPANGSEAVTIAKATPAFGSLTSRSIEAGTASTTIGGSVSFGALVPTGTVSITLGGSTQSAAVGPGGGFAASFATAALAPSAVPYVVTFGYSGDANFEPIAGAGSIQVVDNTAPVISGVSATPDALGPPNHKMIDVTLAYQATDLGADGHTVVTAAPSCGLSVTSSEPVNGIGDGNTGTDWLVIDAHHVQLRDERAGTGGGRVYTIAIACTDAAGNRGSSAATVRVPK